jgi:hypothetical protein
MAADAQQQQRHHQQRHKQQRRGSNKASKRHSNSTSSQGSDVAGSRALTAAIGKAASWQHLQQLLQADGSAMNHIHAAALLNRTSKLVQYEALSGSEQQAAAFGAFYVEALQLAYARAQDSAGPRELSSMLWAVARVGLHPGDDWLAAYLQAAQPQLPAMNAQDLGLLVWALGRFKHVPEPAFCHALLAAAATQLAATGDSSSSGSSSRGFDAQGLSNMLWGLAVLELQPGQPWLASAVGAAHVLLQQQQQQHHHHQVMEPQGLAVLLWALAKLGHRPDQAWLQAAADAAAARLRRFKPAELAMLVHALARLHYQPAQHREQQLGQQEQEQQQQPLLQQVAAAIQPHMQCLRFAEAANLLWGLAVMGQQPGRVWVDALLLRLQATFHEGDAKALASACYALAKLQHQPSVSWWAALWQQLPLALGAGDGAHESSMQALDAPVYQQGAGAVADSQAQATLLLALAKLGAQLPQHVAGCLLAASQQQLEAQAANGAEVVGLAMAAAKLRLKPHIGWLAALERQFEALLHHSCQQQQQQEHLSAALLLHPPLKPTEVANTALSLARLRHVPAASVVAAVEQYMQQHEHALTDADRQQLSRALMSFTDQRKGRAAAAAAAAAQLRAAQAAAAPLGAAQAAAAPLGAAPCTCGGDGTDVLLQHEAAAGDGHCCAPPADAANGDSSGRHAALGSVAVAAAAGSQPGRHDQHHQQHSGAAVDEDGLMLFGKYSLRLEVCGSAANGFTLHTGQQQQHESAASSSSSSRRQQRAAAAAAQVLLQHAGAGLSVATTG